MLRMIIVDDEAIIRETIRNLIDWESLDIKVVAACENGIEAYDAIVDEYPDIVLTDIKMPGLSGLELIQRITQTYDKIEFVILSGYGEFSFAAEAMKYGVKHYLLKPCNEEQIIEVIREVKQDCYRNHAERLTPGEQEIVTKSLHVNILQNIFTQGISSHSDIGALSEPYSHFLDFSDTPYELCYFYYLPESDLTQVLQQLQEFHLAHSPGILLYEVYVRNTLMVFFESYRSSYEQFDEFARGLMPEGNAASIEYKRESFRNLKLLLHTILDKTAHYDMIYYINDLKKIPIYNYNTFFQKIEQVLPRMGSTEPDVRKQGIAQLKEILSAVNNPDFLKSLITNILLKLSIQSGVGSPSDAGEFLLAVNDAQDVKGICGLLYCRLEHALPPKPPESGTQKAFIVKICNYVGEHLGDPNLSLKWISENYLFMNVDYVSKQFVKQVGQKFSNYLNEMRIQKAKELLLECGAEKIYVVAEQIGCGNHPQYFSQLFKKYTGMTPTAFVKRHEPRRDAGNSGKKAAEK